MLKNLRKTQIKSITLTIYRTEWSGVLHHTMLCVINTPLQSKSESEVAHSCPTLCDPMDYKVHGILQARILEWVAISFSRDLPNPGIEPGSPTLQADALLSKPPGKHAY